MKNPIILLITILFFNKATISQNRDSAFIKKNELGIDIIPIIKIFSDPTQKYNYRGTLQYKRALNKSLFFRLGFTAIKKTKFNKYSNPRTTYIDSIHGAIQYHKYDYKPELQINAGLEYKWGKKRLKYFTGLDIGFAHSKEIYTEYYGIREKYSYLDPNGVIYSGDMMTSEEIHDSIVRSYSTIKNGICFTPFYGVQYHFSKKMFFSMQLGIQIQYFYGRRELLINEFGFKNQNFNQTRFGANGILNNFSLVYCF